MGDTDSVKFYETRFNLLKSDEIFISEVTIDFAG